MSAHFQEIKDPAEGVESLRLDQNREDHKRAEALLAGENRILEMIAKSGPLVPILDALCRLVEEVSPGSLATILLLDSESNRLWHAAAPSLPQGAHLSKPIPLAVCAAPPPA